jgi:heterodisulfide reductase subunit C
MLQTEIPANDEKILKSHSIWLCVTCEMCLSRCPMEIDIPSMMDYLRQKSRSEGKQNPKAKNIIAFHKSFLSSIKHTGRLFELGLIIDYKRQSLNLFQDAGLAPKMISRGKLHFMPEKLKDMAHIAKIFKNTSK